MTDNPMDIQLITKPSEQQCDIIVSAVNDYGMAQVSGEAPVKFAIHVTRAGEVIAGAVARMHFSQCYLDHLWVAEADRGRGIAQQVHQRLEAYAIEQNCRRIQLNTLNAKALPLYQRLGYVELAVIAGYVDGFNLHYMAKDLS